MRPLVLIGQDLVLEGPRLKIEDKQVPDIRIDAHLPLPLSNPEIIGIHWLIVPLLRYGRSDVPSYFRTTGMSRLRCLGVTFCKNKHGPHWGFLPVLFSLLEQWWSISWVYICCILIRDEYIYIYYHLHDSVNRWLATPKRWSSFRGHDKPRLMGVAIAIDPFQVVYIPKYMDTIVGRNPNNHLGWYWNSVNSGITYQPQLVKPWSIDDH